MRARRARAWLGAVGGAALVLLAARAGGQGNGSGPGAVDLRRDGERVVASFSYRSLLDAAVRASFRRGLPAHLVAGIQLWRRGDSQPVGYAAQTCSVVYDLWEERFLVHVATPGAQFDRATTSEDEMLRLCADVRGLTFGDRTHPLGSGAYSVVVAVELNPMSPEMVQRIRHWLANPAGESALGTSGTLFGSVVGLFVDRDLDRAERSFRFRSREVRLP